MQAPGHEKNSEVEFDAIKARVLSCPQHALKEEPAEAQGPTDDTRGDDPLAIIDVFSRGHESDQENRDADVGSRSGEVVELLRAQQISGNQRNDLANSAIKT